MTGVEPATSGITIRRSNQLSYIHHFPWHRCHRGHKYNRLRPTAVQKPPRRPPAPPPAPKAPAEPQLSRKEIQEKLLREAEEARMAALEGARRREEQAKQQVSEEEKRRAEDNRKAEEAAVEAARLALEEEARQAARYGCSRGASAFWCGAAQAQSHQTPNA